MVESGLHGSVSLIGIGLVVLGSSIGIGMLVASPLQAIARQPEAANKIQPLMFIFAALIEGIALFGIVLCLLNINK